MVSASGLYVSYPDLSWSPSERAAIEALRAAKAQGVDTGIALKKWTPKIRAGEVLLRGVRMKTKVRTPYTAECKREALAMVASSEQTLPEVARALGISRNGTKDGINRIHRIDLI